MRGEIELLAATESSRRDSASESSPNITIHGPVGIVQTGNSSYGIAHQHIDSGANEALSKALMAPQSALDQQTSDVAFDRDEVRAIVVETTAELKSPKPNGSKVRALVTGIGEAIAWSPHLKEVYDTLKWAGSLAGIAWP